MAKIAKIKRSDELIIANRELAFQNKEKEERAAELIIANKELAFQNEQKEERAAELIVANIELEYQNEEKEKRAAEFIVANKELVYQNREKEKRADELIMANKELVFQNEEKEKRADELIIANKELAYQNEEKEKRADELIIANKKLAFQNKEKQKRADELFIANKELAIQNREKEKRADELIIANKELAYQNKEKEKRADELIIANKELIFQNEEKDKRAAELVIADKELVFQKNEKEKRADELIIADKELAYQSKEKEKRASELGIANKELHFQNEEKEKRAAELAIADKELVYQSEEKGKRAAELSISNEARRETNEYLENLLNCTSAPIIVWNTQNKITRFNKAFEYITGRTEKEVLGKSLEIFFPSASKDSSMELIRNTLGGERLEVVEINVQHIDGSVRILQWNSANVMSKDEKTTIATIAQGNDITTRKRAEEEVRKLNEILEQKIERAEQRAAELVIANKELDFQNEEKEKRADELIIANKELAFQNKEKQSRADELIIANKELLFQNEEKEKRADELIIANKELVYQNEEKEKRAAELVIADKEIVIQNEVKEKQEATNKELEAFTYSVSHDLRAPLRAINGYARILQEEYAAKLDTDGLSTLNAILSNSKKMGELIDDLLAFSRLGRKSVSTNEINMNVLVKSVMEEEINGNSSRIVYTMPELLPAKGQQTLIKQVWVNLVSNAIKFSEHKPKTIIEIGSSNKDDLVVYYIKDNGAGFDMQYYDKLFGIFQRLHSQEEFEGTGIGLAIVQKIVNRHNGTVWAESKLNEGSCFYFSLPGINS